LQLSWFLLLRKLLCNHLFKRFLLYLCFLKKFVKKLSKGRKLNSTFFLCFYIFFSKWVTRIGLIKSIKIMKSNMANSCWSMVFQSLYSILVFLVDPSVINYYGHSFVLRMYPSSLLPLIKGSTSDFHSKQLFLSSLTKQKKVRIFF